MRLRAPIIVATLVSLSLPGAALALPPIVTITAPAFVNEGDPFEITVSVIDPDGATPTWSFDTDGDGFFGEFANQETVLVAGAVTDDPLHALGVQATDGTESVIEIITIEIRNVEPTITSEPLTTASVRQEYTYDPRVSDPAGRRDALTYLMTARPTGMTIEDSHIAWTPEPDQRGREFRAILRVNDGDGGEAIQMWTILVANNQPPGAAEPAEPIERMRVDANAPVTLRVMNAEDLDADELIYRFELSRTSSFENGSMMMSGPIAEGASGTTEWTSDSPLPTGLWYWRVHASDGIEDGPTRYAQVVVGDGSFFGDAGMDTGTGSCTITPAREGRFRFAAIGTGLLAALVFLRRRGR